MGGSKGYDVKMREKLPSFVETGSCFDTTKFSCFSKVRRILFGFYFD